MNTLPKIDTQTLSRALIGFDSMLNSVYANSLNSNYPPHNMIKISDDQYMIEMAVTGFKKSEISVSVEQGTLIIRSSKENIPVEMDYLYRGLSLRNFTKQFKLAEHIEVTSANIEDGILSIHLMQIIPEDKKPKLIEIQ